MDSDKPHQRFAASCRPQKPHKKSKKSKHDKSSRPANEEECEIPFDQFNNMHIGHLPVQCPLAGCNQLMGTTEIMAHYIRDHGTYDFQFKELFSGEKAQMLVNLENLIDKANGCLGMLVYAGINGEPDSRPAEHGLSSPNSFLPPDFERFEKHLPVLIMVCKTSNHCFIRATEEETEDPTHPAFSEQQIFLIWLASVETTEPLQCTISACDKTMTISRSKIVKLRKLSDSQNVDEFAAFESNYLLLRYNEMQKLANDADGTINIELILTENLE